MALWLSHLFQLRIGQVSRVSGLLKESGFVVRVLAGAPFARLLRGSPESFQPSNEFTYPGVDQGKRLNSQLKNSSSLHGLTYG